MLEKVGLQVPGDQGRIGGYIVGKFDDPQFDPLVSRPGLKLTYKGRKDERGGTIQ
jgi:hypothetical protein